MIIIIYYYEKKIYASYSNNIQFIHPVDCLIHLSTQLIHQCY